MLGVQRIGAWLRAEEREFVLLHPLYAIADAIDRFRREDDADIESRLLAWGRIAELLPTNAIVDDHLRGLKIVVASSFELDPFLNANGEPDFDPVVGRRELRVTETGDKEQVFTRTLPVARQQEFAKRFRGLRRVKHRYSVGAGTFVVLTPDVERALIQVRRAQSWTVDKRRDFLKNTSGYLTSAVADDDPAESVDLDSVFSDANLSERVIGVGIWVDKALPWIARPKEPWLPPETLGLRVGEHLVPLSPDELPELLDRIRSAQERGDPTIPVQGIDIPVDRTTITAIKDLIGHAQPMQTPGSGREPKPPDGPPKPPDYHVLEIIDNLQDVQFRGQREPRTPSLATFTPALRSDLYPHQQDGLAWLKRRWDAGSWGALLADDMGLGKTLEVLAFLSCLKRYDNRYHLTHRPVLIVAPTGLLPNWQNEHDKHLSKPGLGQVLNAHGAALRKLKARQQTKTARNGKDSGELTEGLPLLDLALLSNADWVLTSYETLRNYQHSFGHIRWQAGIFDEAQKIKNPGARVTDAALAMNIDFAIIMTGTPVENRPSDIWSMLDRVDPGRFGPLKEFSGKYETAEADDDSLAELHLKLTRPLGSEPKLMLRRLKEDHISGLPDKHLHRLEVEMPPRQAEAYAAKVRQATQDHSILRTIHHLRSISLHPAAPANRDFDEYVKESARLSKTFEILESIRIRREKALLFVDSREMQGFLVSALRRYFSLPKDVLVINGAVAGQTRKARVDLFENRAGFDIMILSPRAGGVGLTLTAANHVIHLSRWWNPAVEDQCTDRVFRIGQHRSVHVYLPLARHPQFGEYSFDLKLDNLMKRKREMNRKVLAPVTATNGDMSDLFHDTVTRVQDRTEEKTPSHGRTDFDLLEPEAFEEWVLQQFQAADYEVRRTPRSGDRGCDGLAYSGAGTNKHTILLQCKHTQSDRKCGREAVKQVLRSITSYADSIKGSPRPMVVTNAAGFTAGAKWLATRKKVELVARDRLTQLRGWRGGRSQK